MYLRRYISVLEHLQSKYKKSWFINACIARELAIFSTGDRLPTIQEFTERLHSSRGIVQKALGELQNKGGIGLEKRGKMGTYITALKRDVLLREGGVEYITATMPSPLNNELVALASGICDAMGRCPLPFNFAFVQSAERRIMALSREVYDFAITSLASARKLCAKYSNLNIMSRLDGCVYSTPFVLYRNKPGIPGAGDRTAADPAAVDQYLLTQKLCKGKKITIIERPYLTCRAMFLSGDIDFLVYRDEQRLRDTKSTVIPIEGGGKPDYLIPAVLINKNNYHIASILKLWLDSRIIAEGQSAVLEFRREPIVF
jgi:hypothetical protein